MERVLQQVSGVRLVYVNPGTEMAYVAYDPALCTLDQIVAAIECAGFKPGSPSFR